MACISKVVAESHVGDHGAESSDTGEGKQNAEHGRLLAAVFED
jgi:hypothetical protein